MSSNSVNDILYGYIQHNQKELLEEALKSSPTPVDFILIKSAILIKNFQVIPTLFTNYCENFCLKSEQIENLLDYCAMAGDIRTLDYFLLHKSLNLDVDKCINKIIMTASINGHFHMLDYLYNLKPSIIEYMEQSLGETFLINSGANVWLSNIKDVLKVRSDLHSAIPVITKESKSNPSTHTPVEESINKI